MSDLPIDVPLARLHKGVEDAPQHAGLLGDGFALAKVFGRRKPRNPYDVPHSS